MREGRRIKNLPPQKRSVSINTSCKYNHVPMDSVTHIHRVHFSTKCPFDLLGWSVLSKNYNYHQRLISKCQIDKESSANINIGPGRNRKSLWELIASSSTEPWCSTSPWLYFYSRDVRERRTQRSSMGFNIWLQNIFLRVWLTSCNTPETRTSQKKSCDLLQGGFLTSETPEM